MHMDHASLRLSKKEKKMLTVVLPHQKWTNDYFEVKVKGDPVCIIWMSCKENVLG